MSKKENKKQWNFQGLVDSRRPINNVNVNRIESTKGCFLSPCILFAKKFFYNGTITTWQLKNKWRYQIYDATVESVLKIENFLSLVISEIPIECGTRWNMPMKRDVVSAFPTHYPTKFPIFPWKCNWIPIDSYTIF